MRAGRGERGGGAASQQAARGRRRSAAPPRQLERRRVGRRGRRHLRHVPYLLQERRQLPVLQLQRDAHVGVLRAERAQLRQHPEDLAEDDGAAG